MAALKIFKKFTFWQMLFGKVKKNSNKRKHTQLNIAQEYRQKFYIPEMK